MANQLIVIGGGPAGMMAALSAAKAGAAVTLWERNDSLGIKLSITGKGRCNITNNAPTEDLIKNMPGNGTFLYGAFSRFPARATMDFFTELGVELKTERGRRVFPLSDSAYQVVEALQNRLRKAGVSVHYRRRATRLLIAEGRISGVQDTRGERQAATAVVLATGGASYPATGSSGDGYKIARAVGHDIIEPRPALAPLETYETWPGELTGLSLKNVCLSASNNGKMLGKEFGELLFTHFGLSGPIVLSLSRAVTALPHSGAGVMLALDLKPALSAEQLDKRLLRDVGADSRKQVSNALSGLTPAALLPLLLSLAEIPANKYAHQLSRAERVRLAELLKALPLTVKGPRPLAEAIITAGGVNVKEVDPKTMGSKKLSGLFFAGELLDVDGFTGGYNLQAAWASGFVAGQSAAFLVLLEQEGSYK
jgi:predicted Rossmann fold flavoprotein